MGDKLGIYIHIPFCRSKCDYCDFYSLSGREGRMDHYQKALLAHLRETAPLTQGIPVDSVYFGGGTPTTLTAEQMDRVHPPQAVSNREGRGDHRGVQP